MRTGWREPYPHTFIHESGASIFWHADFSIYPQGWWIFIPSGGPEGLFSQERREWLAENRQEIRGTLDEAMDRLGKPAPPQDFGPLFAGVEDDQ